MGWTILILISKSKAYTQGIGLLEFFWKVMKAIIDTRIKKAMDFHYVLYILRAGRGMGTAIMELNITQDLDSVDQDQLLLVLLDLKNCIAIWTEAVY